MWMIVQTISVWMVDNVWICWMGSLVTALELDLKELFAKQVCLCPQPLPWASKKFEISTGVLFVCTPWPSLTNIVFSSHFVILTVAKLSIYTLQALMVAEMIHVWMEESAWTKSMGSLATVVGLDLQESPAKQVSKTKTENQNSDYIHPDASILPLLICWVNIKTVVWFLGHAGCDRCSVKIFFSKT